MYIHLCKITHPPAAIWHCCLYFNSMTCHISAIRAYTQYKYIYTMFVVFFCKMVKSLRR